MNRNRSSIVPAPQQPEMRQMTPSDPANEHRATGWRWPNERRHTPGNPPAGTPPQPPRHITLPAGIDEHARLRQAVIEAPDDDQPRIAYAAWMRSQRHELAASVGEFVSAQLAVANAFRASPRADVAQLRGWNSRPGFVSTADFRAGDSLRPWLIRELWPLMQDGLVGWPQLYRGFVERVAMRASRFVELADDLFKLAPIRHLVLIRVPRVVRLLARCPHLAHIHSISLPCYVHSDELTDDTLAELLASPYLGNVAYLRLVDQQRITLRGYERIVTAPALPQLSCFESYTGFFTWAEPMREMYDPIERSERMLTRDTTRRVTRTRQWIPGLEHRLGYVPAVHPEEHYSPTYVDLEAVTEHPIALDPVIMARRGQAVPDAPAEVSR
jgi:uncharacterized protein (TIGR02996 family)